MLSDFLLLLCPFFYNSLCHLVFFSSPSHSLIIWERLILCSCCQQELLALPDSKRRRSLHFSCLVSRSTPPLFTSPLLSPPLSHRSEMIYFSLQTPLLCLLCSPFFLFYFIPQSACFVKATSQTLGLIFRASVWRISFLCSSWRNSNSSTINMQQLVPALIVPPLGVSETADVLWSLEVPERPDEIMRTWSAVGFHFMEPWWNWTTVRLKIKKESFHGYSLFVVVVVVLKFFLLLFGKIQLKLSDLFATKMFVSIKELYMCDNTCCIFALDLQSSITHSQGEVYLCIIYSIK